MVYYGSLFGMSREEVLSTRWGEMLDLISCHAIYNGAKPKKKKKHKSFEELFNEVVHGGR